ncbi:MAG TPA: DUF2071 domain-containing protein [Solirubrobacterales bacterium]|jgi:uncharacterized protein YqjF (DUF2071 family)|nr:DUF2071 domain-containing protein [Solirubrobacterales bacterium]HZA88953.1 DUF2071 domain-containing protein [Solirubrobacterales bacterium]
MSGPLAQAAGVAESLMSRLPWVSGAFPQSSVLAESGHRPWQLPRREWFMGQTWSTLLFAHWPVPRESLEPVVPPQLPIDSFDGQAWVGVTPFEVSGLRLRGTAPVPRLSHFPELNVRTYVTVKGKPGIYFLSLDAARRAAVLAARRIYRLPYFHARMARIALRGGIEFSSERRSSDGPPAAFAARYAPAGEVSQVMLGSLEYFLTERYCLYTLDEGQRVLRADIHHPPWPLQRAEAEIEMNTMAVPFGIHLEGAPLLHYSKRQDVVIWPLASVGA